MENTVDYQQKDFDKRLFNLQMHVNPSGGMAELDRVGGQEITTAKELLDCIATEKIPPSIAKQEKYKTAQEFLKGIVAIGE